MKRIWSLTVDKISLLTEEHTPAVQKAWIWHAILKFFRREDTKTVEKSKFDTILENIEKVSQKREDPRLNSIFEKMKSISK